MRTMLTLLSLTLLASCAPGLGKKYLYTYKLTGDHAVSSNGFKDDVIEATIQINEKDVNLMVKNNSSEPIRLFWDDASLIVLDESRRVIHGNIKLIDKSRAQVSTVIPGGTYIRDIIAPSDAIVWMDAVKTSLYTTSAGWQQAPILPIYDMKKRATRELILGMKGKYIKLFLPVEVQGTRRNYMFPFEITEVKEKPYVNSAYK